MKLTFVVCLVVLHIYCFGNLPLSENYAFGV